MQKKALLQHHEELKLLCKTNAENVDTRSSNPYFTAAAFSFCMMRKCVDDVQSVNITKIYL